MSGFEAYMPSAGQEYKSPTLTPESNGTALTGESNVAALPNETAQDGILPEEFYETDSPTEPLVSTIAPTINAPKDELVAPSVEESGALPTETAAFQPDSTYAPSNESSLAAPGPGDAVTSTQLESTYSEDTPQGETLPPEYFSGGTLAPNYFANLTLSPEVTGALEEAEDLPWFLEGNTLAPEVSAGGTFPPFLMANGTLAPGIVQNGEIDLNFIKVDWTKDLLPDIQKFDLSAKVNATSVYREQPFFEYNRAPLVGKVAGIPRFGRTQNFASLGFLVNDNESAGSEGEDYLLGLSFTAGAMMAFFLLWWVFLFISKCCCRNFLSGSPFATPNTSEEELKEKENDRELANSKVGRRAFRSRIVFFVAGLTQIVFAVLLVVKGVPNLYETTNSFENSFSTAREILAEAKELVVLFRAARDLGETLHDRMNKQFDFENPCPGFSSFSESDLGDVVTEAVQSTVDELAELVVDLDDGIESLDDHMIKGEDNIDTADESAQSGRDYEMIGNLIALPYLVLASLFLIGIVAAQRNVTPSCFLTFLSWVTLPLFVLVTLFSTVVCLVLMITAAMNADFCGADNSTPEQTILDLMINSGKFNTSDSTYTLTEFFLLQCTARASVDPLLELRQYDNDIIAANEVITNFTDSMTSTSIKKISFGCQKDFEPLFDAFEEMKSLMELGREIISGSMDLLDCERISTIYQDLVYEATCTYSISGFTWCAACLFIVSLMGMIMITLRSSYQNTEYLDGGEGNDVKDLSGSDGKVSGGATLDEEDALGSSSTDEKGKVANEENELEEEDGGVVCVEEKDGEECTDVNDSGDQMQDFSAGALESADLNGDDDQMQDFSVGAFESTEFTNHASTTNHERRTPTDRGASQAAAMDISC